MAKKNPYSKVTIIIEDDERITTYSIPQAKGFRLERFSIPTGDLMNLTFVKDLIDVGIKFRVSRNHPAGHYIQETSEKKVKQDD